MNKIFYIMGKSGTGKDTMFKLLCDDIESGKFLVNDCGIVKPIIMNTTRPKRTGEIDGLTYNFVTKEQMQKDLMNDKIIELRTYHTQSDEWHYYTSKDSIKTDDCSYIALGTPVSYAKMKEIYGDMMVPIMILVEKDERFLRLVEREKGLENPNYLELCRRFLVDEADDSQFSIERTRELIHDEPIHDFLNDDVYKCYMMLYIFIVDMIRRKE